MSAAVRIRGVGVRYPGSGEDALRDVDLDIEAGQVVLVTGRSGCGKSTLTGLVNGLVPHLHEATITGTVEIDGLQPREHELYEMGRFVSTVFQNPRTQFFCADSTAELAFAGENAGLAPEAIRAQIAVAAELLGTVPLLDRAMATLSGGQKQQVAVTAAVVNNPRLYVFDEPTSNLDVGGIAAVRDLLVRLRAEGASVLITEHRLGFLRGLVDRVLVLDRGRTVLDLPGAEFFCLDDEVRVALGLRTLDEPVWPPRPWADAESVVETDAVGLEVSGLVHRHRRSEQPVLALERLHLSRGRVNVLVGENGAGKSTLVRLLSGLTRRRTGEIRLDGRILNHRALLRRSHVVLQDVNRQLFSASVAGEVQLAHGLVEPHQVLEQLGLGAYVERHPMSLSGGQRQRLAVATAVAADKDLMFFDEPTSGLDHEAMLATAGLLRQLADQGRVVVVVTHDIELAEQCSDAIVQLPARGGSTALE